MEQVGVEAIVEGLAGFIGDMKKMDDSVKDLGTTSSFLGDAFKSLGNILSGMVSGVFRTLQITFGVLLRDAIRLVIDELRELISSALETTTEFQKLEVRLNRMNFNDLTEDEKNLGNAMEIVTQQTQEQLKWTIKLGANTPFDSRDIANVYSLARSYGFANNDAKALTAQITDFASGMGLSNEAIERIVINFGQMMQQGKITGTEIKDLARGAFVPVNDILDRVAENLGITQEQLASLRKKGLTDAEMFFVAFGQMVDDDFEGAAQDMNKVLAVSIENIKEMARSFLAFNIIKPIFESLSRVFVGFQKSISSRFDSLFDVTQRIGKHVLDIINTLTGGLDSETFADEIVNALNRISIWLALHKDDIIAFFVGLGETISTRIVPFITDTLIPAFNKISDWVTNNKGTIFDFFDTLGQIVSDVFANMTGGAGEKGEGGLEGFLGGISAFMQFVIDNKDEITKWTEILLYAFIVWQLISAALNALAPILTFLATGILFLVNTWGLLVGILGIVWQAVLLIIAVLSSPITLAILGVIAAIVFWIFMFNLAKDQFIAALNAMKIGLNIWKQNFTDTIQRVREAFLRGDWVGIGVAIISGLIRGIGIMAGSLAAAARAAAESAIRSIKRALGIRSPSQVFMGIGEMSMQGMAKGIEKFSGLAENAMAQAGGRLAMSAMPVSQTSNTYQNTNNYNLQIHSSAATEPIIQDFGMLQSLSGV